MLSNNTNCYHKQLLLIILNISFINAINLIPKVATNEAVLYACVSGYDNFFSTDLRPVMSEFWNYSAIWRRYMLYSLWLLFLG